MDLNDDLRSAQLRGEIRSFIAANVPVGWRGVGALDSESRGRFLREWRTALIEHQLIAPAWPREYGGGGLDPVEQAVVLEEFSTAGVPLYTHPNDPYGFNLLGPTLLHWGTDDQKDRFIGPTIGGDITWAQGYSEPEAGSDLFSLRTRAELRGEQWIVNGSKIWQSAGLTANWIFALVRTDPSAERSKGISFLMIPIDQPGVQVRGIENMAGEVEFAEVFFTDAHTASDNLVGGVNNGAKVALTLLGFERGAGGFAAALANRHELNRLVALAEAHGVLGDPLIRQRIARCYTTVQIQRCIALKGITAGAQGAPPGPESSITKLLASEYRKAVTELAVDILGIELLAPEGVPSVEPLAAQPLGLDALSSRAWTDDFLHARPGTVYGGSSEIQRNTIAEQVLGMPREPRMSIAVRR
jgi:alkylation response protein AidB-like acyl-CoA dehydrogenase